MYRIYKITSNPVVDFAAEEQKMVLGWAAFHQSELLEDWELAAAKQELFPIDPLH